MEASFVQHLERAAKEEAVARFAAVSLSAAVSGAAPTETHAQGDHRHTASIQANFRGHVIAIGVTYTFTVDGSPLHIHVDVDDEGRLCSHTLPYVTFLSPVDLVRHFISIYPEEQ